MQDSEVALFDLEFKLAGFVRSYIRASASGYSAEQQEALRWVCSGLEYLLGTLLEGCEGWSGWIDGIVPATDMVPDSVNLSELTISVRGRADWGKNASGPFWIEPFFASVRIAEASNAIVSYELLFAEAARGLGDVRYGKHLRRVDWFFPVEWKFKFMKGRDLKCLIA